MKDASKMTDDDVQNFIIALAQRMNRFFPDPLSPMPSYPHSIEKYNEEEINYCRRNIELLRQVKAFETFLYTEEAKKEIVDNSASGKVMVVNNRYYDKSKVEKIGDYFDVDKEMLMEKGPDGILIDLSNQLKIMEYKIFVKEFSNLAQQFNTHLGEMEGLGYQSQEYFEHVSNLNKLYQRMFEIKPYLEALPTNPVKVDLFKISQKDVDSLVEERRLIQAQYNYFRQQLVSHNTKAFKAPMVDVIEAAVANKNAPPAQSAQQTAITSSTVQNPKVTSATPSATHAQQAAIASSTNQNPKVAASARPVASAPLPQQNQAIFNKEKFQSALITIETNISRILSARSTQLQALQGKDYNPSAMNDIKTQSKNEMLLVRNSLGILRQQWNDYCVQKHQSSPQNASTDREFPSQITSAFKHLDDKIRKAETTINEKSMISNKYPRGQEQSLVSVNMNNQKPRAQ